MPMLFGTEKDWRAPAEGDAAWSGATEKLSNTRNNSPM